MTRIEKILLLFSAVFFAAFCAWNISRPGFQYDELLFANAALGVDTTTFIFLKIGAVPFYVLNYIGALKSWAYVPLFRLFGFSYLTVRLPMILLVAVTVPFFYRYVKAIAGRAAAVAALVLTYLNPSFMGLMRLDVGPSAIAYTLRIFSFVALFAYLKSRRLRCLAVFALFCFLGFFNKMDYAWFITGSIVALGLSERERFITPFVARTGRYLRWFIIVSVSLLGLEVLMYAAYFNYLDMGRYAGHFLEISQSLLWYLDGSLFLAYLNNTPWSWTGAVFASVFLMLFAFGGIRSFSKGGNRQVRFHFLLTVFIFIQVTALLIAREAWHTIYLFPSFTIVASAGLAGFLEKKKSRVFAAGALAVAAVYYAAGWTSYLRAFDGYLKNIYWSNSVNELAAYAKKSPARFVAVDWGIQNQLLVMNREKGKYFDMWRDLWALAHGKAGADRFRKAFFGKKDVIFILHPPGQAFSPPSQDQFLRIVREAGYRLVPVATVRDAGRPVFLLYTLQK